MTTPSPRIVGKTGRLPNQGRLRVSLTADHVPASYTPPVAVDYYSHVPASTWGMDGNDQVGDCTCADVDHELKLLQIAAGNSETVSTTTEVIAAYSAITGYTPSDPNSDQGAEMQKVREYWQKSGFKLGNKIHKIALFADLNVTDMNLVKWSLDQFGAIGLGVNLPDSAQNQFGAGEPWTIVQGSQIDGGHAIALVGYDTSWLYILTWGQVQRVAYDWFAAYVEEAWVSISTDFVNAITGKDALGGTLFDLGAQFEVVTKKPNPFPAPAPVPVPGPTPVPVPVPTPGPSPAPVPVPPVVDADHTLAAAVRTWAKARHVGANKQAAAAVTLWLEEKVL